MLAILIRLGLGVKRPTNGTTVTVDVNLSVPRHNRNLPDNPSYV
jgi:hypothetical protein